MGRSPKFSTDQILDAAQSLLASGGSSAATVVAIAEQLGAPSGSVYHRFASRDLIIATLWVRTVRSFQRGYLEALKDPDRAAARVNAVRHVLRWSADNPDGTGLLLQYSRERLLATWPDDLGEELRGLNDSVQLAITEFAADWFGGLSAERIGRTRLALIELPYAAVRQQADGEPVADWVVDAVLAASSAVLGDRVAKPEEQKL
ncbi:TetR/AcrR family transcriptional regulator [Leucobacter viscericola]|uniref:TetR/AcrR family transcriptional regulator n=1 Tax=Leucobacter viscericola TaxID=2714935 RepID=A0A6G7XB30_9MICO|nr:TetR/AcrR family transcriptional regulator [Leucobacter viscericola]QIK61810.1 TetR/AcrR family transcriptional regulator [Leucobacter viscericola]